MTNETPSASGAGDKQMPASPPSRGILGWMRTPSASMQIPIPPDRVRQQRERRDSSSLTPDEALNISRAHATPASIPRQGLQGQIIEEGEEQPSRGRSNSKYDKLGLITAFSGGPGSF